MIPQKTNRLLSCIQVFVSFILVLSLANLVACDNGETGEASANITSTGSKNSPYQFLFDVDSTYTLVIDDEKTYYIMEGLEPNKMYYIMFGSDDNLSYLISFKNSTWSEYIWKTASDDENNFYYFVEADQNGKIWIEIREPVDAISENMFDFSIRLYSIQQSQGSFSNPFTLSYKNNLPFSGAVDLRDASVYQINELDPNTAYVVSISELSNSATMKTKSSDQDKVQCYMNMFGITEQSCAIISDDNGSLVVHLNSHVLEGSSYTLNIDPYSGLPSEGTFLEHFPLFFDSEIVHSGTVGPNSSYYLIQNLVPGRIYNVIIDDVSGPINFKTTKINEFDNLGNCYPGYIIEKESASCSIEANATGNIWIRIVSVMPAGVSFTISVNRYTGVVSEGTETSRQILSLDLDFPYDGTASPSGSYYLITGLSSKTLYNLSFSNMLEYSRISSNNDYRRCMWIENSITERFCTFLSDEFGGLEIDIDGIFYSSGLSYRFNIEKYSGLPSEGTVMVPKTLNYVEDFPYSGTVSVESSYYEILGLDQNKHYMIDITGFKKRAWVNVYLTVA